MIDKEMLRYLAIGLAFAAELVALTVGGVYLGQKLGEYFSTIGMYLPVITGLIGASLGFYRGYKNYERISKKD